MALTKEDIQQIVDACRPMIAKLIAAEYPARTKKFYQRKAFSLCEEATARGEYIPLAKALELVRGKYEA